MVLAAIGFADGSFFVHSKEGDMEVKLYVGNLSFGTTEDQLRELFSQAGATTSVELIKDRDTGTSRGFAFVTMASQNDAQNAINSLNGKTLDNRELKVNTAKAREDRPSGGGYNDRRGGGRRNY